MAIEASGCNGEGKITPPKITTKLKESGYRKNQKLKQYLQEFQASFSIHAISQLPAPLTMRPLDHQCTIRSSPMVSFNTHLRLPS
jgi:hypothetical protein